VSLLIDDQHVFSDGSLFRQSLITFDGQQGERLALVCVILATLDVAILAAGSQP
jgi:hypothetical protein